MTLWKRSHCWDWLLQNYQQRSCDCIVVSKQWTFAQCCPHFSQSSLINIPKEVLFFTNLWLSISYGFHWNFIAGWTRYAPVHFASHFLSLVTLNPKPQKLPIMSIVPLYIIFPPVPTFVPLGISPPPPNSSCLNSHSKWDCPLAEALSHVSDHRRCLFLCALWTL